MSTAQKSLFEKVDSVYRTRSLGIAATGLPDQYADGKAAKVWEVYIGDKNSRTDHYKNFLAGLLREKKCKTVLDVACGTGVDSVMLIEEGFELTSTDASDKMLKYALKNRWDRRKEEDFDKWVIEEANWLTLPEDLDKPEELGFDAVICLGNSFAHLPDFVGDQRDHKLAMRNFAEMVKPGGILLIDHRNYDAILNTGATPAKNIYYNSKHIEDIKTSVLYVNGKCNMVTLDYVMDVSSLDKKITGGENKSHFRLSYYPHRLEQFSQLVQEAFDYKCKHTVYGDFQPINDKDVPAFYIHIVEKLNQ